MTTDGRSHHPREELMGRTGDPTVWDDRYGEKERLWSGRPNGALVAEVGRATPGRALDVGCGEGADAIWLALQGWTVTALDVSIVALDRARAAAAAAGAEVDWLHAGLLDAALPAAGFDLVSAQYPALLRTPGQDAERALLAAVAPGGTLLFVHHADIDTEEARSHGFDPADYVGPDELVGVLGEDWVVQVDETRARDVPTEGAAHHHVDRVVRAQRRLQVAT